MDRLAVLSDIHGNRWALEAVLEDLDRRQITDVVNLGDSLYGPLDPAGTADLLIGAGWPTVAGNEDRIIIDAEQELSPTLEFVRNQLNSDQLKWIKAQPAALTWQNEFFLMHASLNNDSRYFLEFVHYGKLAVRDLDELTIEAGEIDAKVILTGHSHLPRVAALLDNKLVVNPGSVGLQAYWDDQPEKHVVENNSPQARYAILHRVKGSWRVEQISLDYDWNSAARTARKNKRPDWAYWLRTGFTE